MAQKSFDPDVKDGAGWTPLMIAASLKEGDALVKMLLQKGADVNAKSVLFPTCHRTYIVHNCPICPLCVKISKRLSMPHPAPECLAPLPPLIILTNLQTQAAKQPCTSAPPRTISKQRRSCSSTKPQLASKTSAAHCHSIALRQLAPCPWCSYCLMPRVQSMPLTSTT